MVLIPIQKGKNNFVLKQTHTQMNAEKWKQITSFVNNEQVNQENHSVKRYFWKTTEFSVYWDDYSCLPCQPQVSKWCPICHYLDCRQSSSKVAAKKAWKLVEWKCLQKSKKVWLKIYLELRLWWGWIWSKLQNQSNCNCSHQSIGEVFSHIGFVCASFFFLV